MAKLHILKGSCEGQSFDLEEDVIFIGRAPDNGIQIKDRSVSRVHLQLIRKGSEYFVRDLKSKNGTFVNGEKLSPDAEIRIYEGVPVTIGKSVICIGEECPVEIRSVRESLGLPDKTRPLTFQNNMQLMYDVCDLLTESLDMNEMFGKILDHVLKLLKRIDRGIIITVDNEEKAILKEIYKIRGGGRVNSMFYSLDVVKRVIEKKEAMIISDVYADDGDGLSETLKIIKIGSVMCVPLISKSELRGVIYLDSFENAHGFREEDLQLLTALSKPVAIAIENLFLNLNRYVDTTGIPGNKNILGQEMYGANANN